mmetsp:Transcript_3200/g.8031  ORF Transcript_3200/g.8031 Transcript_3200/m.8031 type:complete len:282 (-) Transcript_3200:133-978(-)
MANACARPGTTALFNRGVSPPTTVPMTTQLMARRFAAAALLRCPATSARRATLRHNSAAPLTAAPVRAMATGGRDDDDKSWSEIASQAAGALKSAAKKVGKGVQKALGQDEATKLERQQKKAREELERPPDLGQLVGGGLVGRMAGAMLGSAVKAMGEQMAAAGRAVADVENRARDAIESDSRVLDLMGGRVEVGPPMSQSSMSSSVNGRVTKQVTLLLPVSGARGRGQAEVVASEGEEGITQMRIQVRTPDGSTVAVDGSGGSGKHASTGRVIDAEWKDL